MSTSAENWERRLAPGEGAHRVASLGLVLPAGATVSPSRPMPSLNVEGFLGEGGWSHSSRQTRKPLSPLCCRCLPVGSARQAGVPSFLKCLLPSWGRSPPMPREKVH